LQKAHAEAKSSAAVSPPSINSTISSHSANHFSPF
jgi:hypothetical protein